MTGDEQIEEIDNEFGSIQDRLIKLRKKRIDKDKKTTFERMWENLARGSTGRCIDQSPDRIAHFLQFGVVNCKFCNLDLKLSVGNTYNLKRHCETTAQIDVMKRYYHTHPDLAADSKFLPHVPTNEEKKLICECKSILEAKVLGLGINPHQMNLLFNPQENILSMYTILTQDLKCNAVATTSSIRSNMHISLDMIKARIKDLFHDLPVIIVADSAGFKHISGVAVGVMSPLVEFAVLLWFLTPEDKSKNPIDTESTVYDYGLAGFIILKNYISVIMFFLGVDIDAVLQEMSIKYDTSTYLMGDNVIPSKALCEVLMVKQGHCICHGLALLPKNCISKFYSDVLLHHSPLRVTHCWRCRETYL